MLFPLIADSQIISDDEMIINTDSVRHAFDNGPHFGLYKDTYFCVGTPLGKTPTCHNSNVKFQISISQRLTRSTLPWHNHLYLYYTQKCFWNVFERSMPMADLNFNPGIGLAKPFFIKNKYIGKTFLLLEHESNGRDGLESRSWNRISFGGSVIIDPMLTVHGKFWIPIIDGKNNRDILDYCGIYQLGMTVELPTRFRSNLSITLVKRRGWRLNYNTIVEYSFRPFSNSNQYFFVQYYNGYGEGLLEYNIHHSMIRAGVIIKPRIFSEF